MKKLSKANEVILKNTGCQEDFIAILLNNGYTVIAKLVSGGDQIEIQFYPEEPEKKEVPEWIIPIDLLSKILEEVVRESEE